MISKLKNCAKINALIFRNSRKTVKMRNLKADVMMEHFSMRSLSVIALAAGALFAASCSEAQESLPGVLETVRANNPEILAVAKRVEAARSAKPQSYLPDKPVLTYERMYSPSGLGGLGGAQEKNFLLSQTIPFPTTLYWRGKMADGAGALAEQDFAAVVARVNAETKTAYARLFTTGKTLELFAENIAILQRLSKVAEMKYSIGHATKSDVLKAQVELSKMIALRILMEQEKIIASAKLNTLMNRPAQSTLVLAADYKPSALAGAATDYAAATLANPSVQAMQLSVEQSGRALKLAKAQYYPDIMLGYRKRSSDNADMNGTQDLMFGFSIPLWFSKQRSIVDEANAQKSAAGLDLQNAANTALYDMQEDFAKASALHSLLELYRTNILPQAQEALDTAETGYQSDRTDFMDLLDAQRTLLGLRLEYYQYLFEHESWLAKLEQTAGGSDL